MSKTEREADSEPHAHPGAPHSHGSGHGHHARHRQIRDQPSGQRSTLAEGAGRGRVLFFDAFSGISGDMTIAALLDLGVPFSVVQKAVATLDLSGVDVRVRETAVGAIGATGFDVQVVSEQPERSYREVRHLLEHAPLSTAVRRLSEKIFRVLAEAEAEVHRVPIDDVHFHEVGAVDSIVDVVGAASCLVYLDADVVCSPLPMGRGFVDSRHGVLPLPAPATIECLKGVPTTDAGIEGELVTPTGAAIVRAVATRFARWPSISPEHVGWGTGNKQWSDRPNVLRVVLGSSEGMGESHPEATHVVLEANIDDMTGEVAGHAIECLLEAGALDAWVAPLTMKKGRPGFALGALAEVTHAERMVGVLLRETTTLGVRRLPVSRVERPRFMRTVETPYGPIPIKISGGPYGHPLSKPEFAECARAAREAGVPVRQVIEAAERAAAEELGAEPVEPG